MHVVCKLAGGTEMQFEADTQAAAWRKMALVADVFGETCCGCCKSTNICVRVRKAQEYEYFEWWCRDCDARLSVGQNQQGGTLFIKRWDKENACLMPDNGWYHYTPQQQQGDQQDSPPRQQGNSAPPQQRGNAPRRQQQQAPQPASDGSIPF